MALKRYWTIIPLTSGAASKWDARYWDSVPQKGSGRRDPSRRKRAGYKEILGLGVYKLGIHLQKSVMFAQ